RLTVKGEPLVLLEQFQGSFSASNNGTLMYWLAQTGPIQLPSSRLVWVDRLGMEMSQVGSPANYRDIRLSPDEHHVVLDKTDENGNLDVFVLDIDTGNSTRITFDPALDIGALWNHNGKQVAFASDRGTNRKIYVHASNGAGIDEVLYAGDNTN